MSVPTEIAIGGVYVPPLLVAVVFALVLAVLTARILNRLRLSQHFFYPPLVFAAIVEIYTVFIGKLFVPI